MTAGNRLSQTRLRYHIRGRADALLTIATYLGWTPELVDTIAADVLALDEADLFHARKRASEYAE